VAAKPNPRPRTTAQALQGNMTPPPKPTPDPAPTPGPVTPTSLPPAIKPGASVNPVPAGQTGSVPATGRSSGGGQLTTRRV